jgi:raffinose/stachyose/melibiose transport system substrate-binding protein
MKRHVYIITATLIILSLLAACAPEAAPTATTAPQNEPAATSAPAQQEVTLKVWDILTSETEGRIADQLNKEFMEANPGVTIARETKTFDQMKSSAKLGLSAADGPDVAQINQGYSDMGALVTADLLVDLNNYAVEYGWGKKLSPGIVARNSFTPDGVKLGEGNLYGVPITAELVGVFYNKEAFQKAGVSVPKTLAEFEEVLQKLKDAGITPINYGSLDGFVNIHIFAEIQNAEVDRKYLDDFIYSRPGATFNTPANLAAATKMVEWVDKEYFTKDFVGIGYDDSVAAFRGGQGAMMITGSWISGDTIAQAPGKFGFFLMPGKTEGAKRMSTGGTSTAFAIRKSSQNVDLAAKYIDWMVSDRAAQLWAESGTVPVGKVTVETADPLFTDLLNAWSYLNENDLVGHYLDWATPTFYDTLNAAFAELMARQSTPQQAIEKIEADYAAYLATRK